MTRAYSLGHDAGAGGHSSMLIRYRWPSTERSIQVVLQIVQIRDLLVIPKAMRPEGLAGK